MSHDSDDSDYTPGDDIYDYLEADVVEEEEEAVIPIIDTTEEINEKQAYELAMSGMSACIAIDCNISNIHLFVYVIVFEHELTALGTFLGEGGTNFELPLGTKYLKAWNARQFLTRWIAPVHLLSLIIIIYMLFHYKYTYPYIYTICIHIYIFTIYIYIYLNYSYVS